MQLDLRLQDFGFILKLSDAGPEGVRIARG